MYKEKYYFNIFFLIPWEINSRFCSKTQRQMFLLVSGRHVSAHLDDHQHTPYADMEHWPFVARDELCKSEARWASVFWFDNASPERSCLVGDLVCLIFTMSFLCYYMPPENSEIFHRKVRLFLVSPFASEGETDEGKEFEPIHDRRGNCKSLFATFRARRS